MYYCMKKILLTFLFGISLLTSYSQSKEEIKSALNIFCQKVMYQDPYGFNQTNYSELAYLKRNFDLPELKIKDSLYIAGLNDYAYKKFYLYSKMLNENAIVTEDCFSDEANSNVHKGTKLLFYCMYPNSVKLPKDIVEQIDEYSTMDEFFGPYTMLYTIYFLKKYNYNNLTSEQKTKLAISETFLSNLIYKKYVENKPWAFYKFLSVKVLKMNNSDLVKNIDISDLVKYFNANGELKLGEDDVKDLDLLKRVGSKEMVQFEINSLLWIFLSELEKK